MTGLELLQQYREEERALSDLEQEVKAARDQAERVTPLYSLVPCGHSGVHQQTEDVALRITELSLELSRRYGAQAERRRSVGEVIDAVPDLKAREVLRLRYIDGLTWAQVADNAGLCREQVFRIHRRALAMLNSPDRGPEGVAERWKGDHAHEETGESSPHSGAVPGGGI